MIKKFDEVFVDKTRLGKKIPKEEYKKKGKYIIIDQGKDKIAGFTDNEDGIFTDVPTIIFGDHTRIIKYIDKPFFLGADGVKVLKSKINNANYKYLYYALKAAYIPNTGYNRHFKWLKKVSINYPSFEKQKRIVKLLDNLSEVKNKKNEELKLCDTLIKARFVEMFGDPGLVHRENKVCNLENVAEVRSSHRIFTREFTKSGVPFYRGTEISLLANGKEPIHSYYISKARYDEITKNDSKPKIGDLLMPSICDKGQIWLVNTSKPFYYKDGRVLCISPNREKFNTIFFHQYMKMKSQIEYLKIGSGSTFSEFKIFQLKKLKINIPPLKLQNEFASFVQQVDKSKVVNVSIMKYIISIRFYLYFKENKEGAR